MNYVVYKITNLINAKIYIGVHKTSNVDDGYMGSGKLIKAAIKKHGLENFKKEILAQFESADEMFNEEKNLISSLSPEYNLHPGGNGGWEYINKAGLNRLSTGARIPVGTKPGRKYSEETKIKLRNTRAIKAAVSGGYPFSGKTHTAETKEKISKANHEKSKGQKNSQYGTKWITDGIHSKKIQNTDSIPVGWSLGRKMLNSFVV